MLIDEQNNKPKFGNPTLSKNLIQPTVTNDENQFCNFKAIYASFLREFFFQSVSGQNQNLPIKTLKLETVQHVLKLSKIAKFFPTFRAVHDPKCQAPFRPCRDHLQLDSLMMRIPIRNRPETLAFASYLSRNSTGKITITYTLSYFVVCVISESNVMLKVSIQSIAS